jgi:predicted MFS family arabinose efflux permease
MREIRDAAGPLNARGELRLLAILALTQVISWGAIYYAFSVLAPAIATETRWRAELVYGAFSWSLLVSGLTAARVGKLLDRHGGRAVMACGSLLAGAGLIVLSCSANLLTYYLAWTMLGVSMSLVLYEAAFATINREFSSEPRKGISTLALFGGLASTVFWPLTIKLGALLGWRDTFLAYGVLQLAVCLPLHLALPARPRGARPPVAASGRRSHTLHEAMRHGAFWKLGLAFATNALIFSAMSAHLIPLLGAMGHAATLVLVLAATIGPLQVAGRLAERLFAHRVSEKAVGVAVFAVLPLAFASAALFGGYGWGIALFCVLYGLSNGVLTIVRGTIPQIMFGRENYGAISGALAGPALVARAAGPIALAWTLQQGVTPAAAMLILFAVAALSLAVFVLALQAGEESVADAALS